MPVLLPQLPVIDALKLNILKISLNISLSLSLFLPISYDVTFLGCVYVNVYIYACAHTHEVAP